MTPEQLKEFEEMKKELAIMRRMFAFDANTVVIKKSVKIDGVMNADRIFTQRSGSYVELTT